MDENTETKATHQLVWGREVVAEGSESEIHDMFAEAGGTASPYRIRAAR